MSRTKIHASPAERQKAYRARKNRALRNGSALRNDATLTKVERPPLRYYGGKWRVGEWIINQFPPHTCYVEPYAGGASVLMQKAPADHEVINDLNGDVVNFFRVLRSNTEDLVRAIWCTPYSREELLLARTSTTSEDPIERARRFYIRCWQSFGSGVGTSSTGWRYGKGDNGSDSSPIPTWNNTDALWQAAARLKLVQIEKDSALEVIKRFDHKGTLFYVDPPYVHSTRYHNSKSKGYAFEMSDDDHRQLAAVLHNVRGMVILSGYPSALYDELYSDWKVVTKDVQNISGKVAETECLWLSPRTIELNHMPLFAGMLDIEGSRPSTPDDSVYRKSGCKP